MTAPRDYIDREFSDDPPLDNELGSSFRWNDVFGGWEDGKVFSIPDGTLTDYDEMLKTDGKAASIEKMLSYPIIAAPWEIDPAKDSDEDGPGGAPPTHSSKSDEITAFIYDALTDLPHQGGPRTTIEQLISQMTMAITGKRAYFEKVFKVRDEGLNHGGMVVYDKIAWRPPETCELALDDRSGDLRGFRQTPVTWNPSPLTSSATRGYVDIPMERAFIYTHGTWRDPLFGISSMEVPYWALAHGSKVQTPYGETNIENISVGDEIYGANGSPTKVVAVHPQGVRQMYRVTFKDGRTVDCDDQHLWGVVDRNGRYTVRSTREMLDFGVRLKTNNRPKFFVPRSQAVEYSTKHLSVDPYILGAWLGDGHIVKDQHGVGRYAVSIASVEDWIPQEVEDRLPPSLKLIQSGRSYYIRPIISHTSNSLRDALVSMGVNVGSYDKFIPDIYLEGSVKQRWELLRGLMDTDGSYGHGTGKPSNASRYHTVSKKLANGVARLVRSLGGTAIVRFKPLRNIYTVELLTSESPFSMPRKTAMWCASERRETLAIVSIEPVNESECCCITVENEDGLFLTNDYVVTHNCYITKRKLRWLWYQFLDQTMLPKTIVKNPDDRQAVADAKVVARLRSRGVVGLRSDTTVESYESSGHGAAGYIEAIRFLDSEMSHSILAGFMDLTSQAAEGKGSYALSESQGKLFLRTRRMVARDMARQLTNDVIGPLVRYNFGNKAPCPRFTFGPLSEQNEQAVLDMFKGISTTGAKVPPDFLDQLTIRVATLLELDPGKVKKDMESMPETPGELEMLAQQTDVATGLVAEAQATGKIAPSPIGPPPGSANSAGGTVPGTDSVANKGAKSSTAKKVNGR